MRASVARQVRGPREGVNAGPGTRCLKRLTHPASRRTLRVMRTILATLPLLALAACISVEPSAMKLPDGLGQAEQVVIDGSWPNRRGTLTAGAYSGDYAWGHDSFDFGPGWGFESEGGRTGFAVTGPGGSVVTGQCDMRERTITRGKRERDGNVTTETEVGAKITPLRYDCGLRRDGKDVGIVRLYEDTLSTRSIVRAARDADVVYDGRRLALRSIHAIEGSPVGTATPTGFTISEGDRVLGAVDTLQPDPVLYIAEDTGEDLREALTVTAVALALFKDPAEGV